MPDKKEQENTDNIKKEDIYKDFWKEKLKKFLVFFISGPAISAFSFIKSLVTGDHLESVRSGIEGGALLLEGAGFTGFVERVRNNKVIRGITNAIEIIFPKPLKTLVALTCGAAAIAMAVGSGLWIALPIVGMITTIACKIWTTLREMKTYKKIESRIKEVGLLNKYQMLSLHKNAIVNLMSKKNPKLDIKKVMKRLDISIVPNPNEQKVERLELPQKKIPGTNILMSIGENLAVFPISISAGLAMAGMQAFGANVYAEMKAEKINMGLKKQINDLKENINYKNINELTEHVNDQIFLCSAINQVANDEDFVNISDNKELFNLLNKKFKYLKEKNKNAKLVRVPNLSSKWQSFKTTQNPFAKYGNMLHARSIELEEESLANFKKNILSINSNIRTTQNNPNQRLRKIPKKQGTKSLGI